MSYFITSNTVKPSLSCVRCLSSVTQRQPGVFQVWRTRTYIPTSQGSSTCYHFSLKFKHRFLDCVSLGKAYQMSSITWFCAISSIIKYMLLQSNAIYIYIYIYQCDFYSIYNILRLVKVHNSNNTLMNEVNYRIL